MQLVFECLEFCLLHCGSTGNDLHNIGVQLARKLLLSYGKRLYYGIGHSYALVKATLRMLAAMVAQGVTIAREMLRSFDFTLKSLQTLANKRNLKVCGLVVIAIFKLKYKTIKQVDRQTKRQADRQTDTFMIIPGFDRQIDRQTDKKE